MNRRRRLPCGVALVMLLAVLDGQVAVARSYQLVEGDPEKCASYVELMSHPVIGRYQHNWQYAGEDGIRSIRQIESLFIPSPPPSPVTLSVVKRPRGQSLSEGRSLTFRFIDHPGGEAGASRTFRALSECKTNVANPNACILDDDRLAARFNLAGLDATRVHGTSPASVLGNSYLFYRFNDRYWLHIAQIIAGPVASRQRFGFALVSPDEVAEGRARSLFEVGCQIERDY